MKRFIGGIVAVVATAALWGCDVVRALMSPTSGSTGSFPTSESIPDPTPFTVVRGEAPVPAPVYPGVSTPFPSATQGAGTVIIVPDGQQASPTPKPSPTSTPPPLWARYTYPESWALYQEFPEEVKRLQAWELRGVKILGSNWHDGERVLYWDYHAREKPISMGFDYAIGEPVYEFAYLQLSEYPALNVAGLLPMSISSGSYDAGYGATFVERDGNLVFHKPGPLKRVTVGGSEYSAYSIAGYKRLDRHLNGDKARIWDFSKWKSEGRVIAPRGLGLENVEITFDPAIIFDETDPEGESVRLAYDQSQGILAVAGGGSGLVPTVWWGAVRETQDGKKKLHVGYRVDLWFLVDRYRRVLAWYISKDTVYAFTGRGPESTCDYVAKGTIWRDEKAGVHCYPEVFKFPLDFIVDPPAKPAWFVVN